MKKISVILPVYNQEKYLNKSLKSVIDQTYSNLEIIVVNDGSTDSSMEIITRFANEDTRFKIVHKPNGGLVDATLAGIANATGEYIAFLDPDDYWGEDFLDNLVCNSDHEDVIASGFYYDNNNNIYPYFLDQTRVYRNEEVDELRSSYLYDLNTEGIPHKLFFSRWNKIYKKEIVDRSCKIFDKCKGVTLGEDSIFTYLVLEQATTVKTISGVNSYYYNVGNQNSMMKSGTIEKYIENAQYAKNFLVDYIGDKKDATIAYALYYYILETMYTRTLNSGKSDYYLFRKYLDVDKDYSKSVKIIARLYKKTSKKIRVLSRAFFPKSVCWYLLKELSDKLKKIKRLVSDVSSAAKNSYKKKNNFFNEIIHNRRRTKAFDDLPKKMPILEERIGPILKKYEDKVTDLKEAPIEKNVFVFWWDGFDKAPEIVKCCLDSVKRHYSDCNVIEISKDNYKNYTDINPVINKDFIKGKISVQTFSDILRFNLLKNNGGLWIDATIFFSERFPMFEPLENKSFESLCFSRSKSFFQYEGLPCTWSGYFIASRKGALLVSVMDQVFEQYYLKYHTYTLYFFIDALFMLAKKYKIDDSVLDKVQYCPHDMFILSKVLNKEYDVKCIPEIISVPQKLAWFNGTRTNENTFYSRLLIEGKE